MTLLALAILWCAAAYRLSVSATRRATTWRTSFTVGLLCVAAAMTIRELRPTLDAATGQPNLANLVKHLLWVGGATSVQIYMLTLTHEEVPRRRLVQRLILGGVAGVGLLAFWVFAPIHAGPVDDFSVLGREPTVVGYFTIVYGVMGWLLRDLVRVAFSRVAGGAEDIARRACGWLIGLGAATGLGVVLIDGTALYMVSFGSQPHPGLTQTGDILLPIAVALLAAGVLVLGVIPQLTRYVNARRRRRELEPLWRHVLSHAPQVRLARRHWGLHPVTRAELVLERQLIEVGDGLATIHLQLDGPPNLASIATALRTPRATGILANELLPPAADRREDTDQLLRLARDFTSGRT